MVELLFGRLDGRSASYAATRDLVERYFPGRLRGDSPRRRPARTAPTPTGGPPEIVFSAEEERGALRLFLRALRRLPVELDWSATVWLRDPSSAATITLPRRLRDRVLLRRAGRRLRGPAPRPGRHRGGGLERSRSRAAARAARPRRRCGAGGRSPAAVRGGWCARGSSGLLFEPRDTLTLAAQLERLVSRARARRRAIETASRRLARPSSGRAWPTSSRRSTSASPPAGTAPAGTARCASDSSSASSCTWTCTCTPTTRPTAPPRWTPCSSTAKAVGLGAIAITDHNEISGALEARERADGIKVIVAEEVKTADQGEVIGLFIEEKIPRGLTLAETIAEIRRQGGLVYVPHPFDRMHAVPDYEHLLEVVEDIDAIEVFNPRVAFSAFNEEAARFAAKYRIVAGAGSDSHVAQGLGSVKIRMRDFDGPEEFLESLRDADIVRKRQSLLYVQALKFIQTKTPARPKGATPGGRRASKSDAAREEGPPIRQSSHRRCPPPTTRSARSTWSARSAS